MLAVEARLCARFALPGSLQNASHVFATQLRGGGGGRDGKARCEGGAALAHDVRVDCAVYSVGNADEEDELLATRDGRETLGDRHHESLIFQCFPDIGLATAPILASLSASRRAATP